MSSVDDLVGKLFPGEKLPPPPGGSTSAPSSTTTSSSSGATAAKKSVHNWDDSDEEEKVKSKTNTNSNNTKPTSQPKVQTNFSSPSSSSSSSSSSTHASSTSAVGQSYHHRQQQAAAWPILPNTLMKCSCSSDQTFTLTNNISDRDSATHFRVLFSSSSSSSSSKSTSVENERDSSVLSAVTGSVSFCPYLQCAKCSHPVVRFQDAYVVSVKSSYASSSSSSSSSSQQQQHQQQKKKEENTSGGGGGGHHHSFDSDSDDDNSSSSSSSPHQNVDPMYMLCRNHFPDFSALDRTGAMRRTPKRGSIEALNNPGQDHIESALYFCQCTIASVLGERLTLSSSDTENNNGVLTKAIQRYSKQFSSPSEVPYCSKSIQWSCVGHHQQQLSSY